MLIWSLVRLTENCSGSTTIHQYMKRHLARFTGQLAWEKRYSLKRREREREEGCVRTQGGTVRIELHAMVMMSSHRDLPSHKTPAHKGAVYFTQMNFTAVTLTCFFSWAQIMINMYSYLVVREIVRTTRESLVQMKRPAGNEHNRPKEASGVKCT